MEKGPLHIYYATQDGTAESFAQILGTEGNEVDVETQVKNLRDFSEVVFRQEDNFVFVVSTHYEGNSPDDADDFNAWMTAHPSVDFLKGKRFCVFGLGDSKYDTFNFFSKAVHSFLTRNGAVEVHPYGMADDSGNTEQDFLRWKEDLWKHWHKVLPDLHAVSSQEPGDGEILKSVGTLPGVTEEQGRYLLVPPGAPVPQADPDLPKDFNFGKYSAAKKAKVVEIKELRQMPTEDLSTLQIELQLPAGETYQTAENMVVFPVNTPKAVEKMLAYLQKTGEERVCLNPKLSPEEQKKTALSFPANKSLCSVLTKFVDIKAPVKKSAWKKILGVLSPQRQAEVAQVLESPLFAESMAKERPDFVDTLTGLGIQLTTGQFLDCANKIGARYFTIASSNVVRPDRVTLMLRVETFKLPSGHLWLGLFSAYIRDLFKRGVESNTTSVRFSFQPSCFALSDNEPGLLMIGTGTGVAPFVGVLQEKVFAGPSSRFGDLVLIFGCRKSNEDYICREFLVDSHGKQHLRTLLTGFSQDGAEKVYVQTVLYQNLTLLEGVLGGEKGRVLICGNLAMCKAVNDVIKGWLKNYLKLPTDDEAEAAFKKLVEAKRVAFEAWG